MLIVLLCPHFTRHGVNDLAFGFQNLCTCYVFSRKLWSSLEKASEFLQLDPDIIYICHKKSVIIYVII